MKHVFFLCLFLVPLMNLANSAEKEASLPIIALAVQPTSLDPHYKNTISSNHEVSSHIFESLFNLEKDGDLVPILVESYHAKTSYKWLFNLKKNIYFHDGSLLTSDDVIATLNRLFNQPKDNTFRRLLGEGLQYEKLSKHSFHLITKQPEPDFIRRLRDIYIISKKYEKLTENDFNQQQGLIGTGPYRWIKKQSMTQFEFAYFEGYHGQKPFLKNVRLQVVQNKQQRIKGLLTGKFQLIDRITPADIKAIKAVHKANFSMPPATKLYCIRLDSYRDQSPFIRDNKGNLLTKNPLKDKRVRQALSKAIDRQSLIDQFFGGTGANPAGQLVSRNLKGYMPRLKPDKQNVVEARKLLAEAGYKEGFQMTLHDKDARKPILEAIAAMFEQIGVTTEVETLPSSEYFPRAAKHDFSIALGSYSSFGYLYDMLANLISTKGSSNYGRYSNPEFDAILVEAQSTFEKSTRYRHYSYAMELAMEDMALIPLYFINSVWASQSNWVFSPKSTGFTLAQDIYPNKTQL